MNLNYLKFLIIVVGYYFIAIMANAQSSSEVIELSEEEMRWIQENSTIISSNYTDWPPIDFYENGVPSGFSVDYVNLLAKKVGLEIEYVSGNIWPALLEQAKNHKIDFVHSIAETDERLEFWNFSKSYLSFPVTFYGRIGSEKLNSSKDLIGKKIGVIEGWSSYSILTTYYPELEIVKQGTVVDALNALSAGEIDAFADRLPTSNYVIAKNFITGIEVIGENILPESAQVVNISLAVRKDWPLLKSILDKAMLMVTDDEYSNLAAKWQTEFDADTRINLTAEEKAWLSTKKVINVAAPIGDLPLSDVNENGELIGISGAYIELIKKQLGVDFKWVGNKSWSEGLEAMKSGEADLLTTVMPTEEREEYMLFSSPYYSVNQMIYSNKQKNNFSNLGSLSGFKIAQVKNYAINEIIIADFPDIEIIEVENTNETLRLLNRGEVDAHIGVISVTANRILEGNFDNVIITGQTPYKVVNAFAVRKEIPILLGIIEKSYQSISPAEKARLSRDWLTIRNEQENTTFTLPVLLVSGFIISLSLIWVFFLLNEIFRRKRVEIELKRSREIADEANKAKSSFLANMSHEIRTPLNAIIGFSDVISSGIFGKIEQSKYIEYVEDIKGSGKQLSIVISDILDLSKIEADKWKLNEVDFDVDRTIEQVIRKYSADAKSKKLDITFRRTPNKGDFVIMGDEVCIKRVFDNLLSNAIKFTDDGGRIKCAIFKEEDGSISITFIDTGVGIVKSRLKQVQSPFGQDHERKSLNKAGIGLVLSIVEKFVNLHQGIFDLKSEVGVGTCATVVIPSACVLEE